MTGDRNHNQTFGAAISRRAGFELSSTPHGHTSLSWRRSSSSFGKSAAGLSQSCQSQSRWTWSW